MKTFKVSAGSIIFGIYLAENFEDAKNKFLFDMGMQNYEMFDLINCEIKAKEISLTTELFVDKNAKTIPIVSTKDIVRERLKAALESIESEDDENYCFGVPTKQYRIDRAIRHLKIAHEFLIAMGGTEL